MIKYLFGNKKNLYTVIIDKWLEYLSLTHYMYPLFNYCYRKKFSGSPTIKK